MSSTDLRTYRDYWSAVGLSAAPTDRRRAETGVRLAYRRAGLSNHVRTIWVGSPMAGAATAAALMKHGRRHSVSAAVIRTPTAALFSRTSKCVDPELLSEVANHVQQPVANRVTATVWQPINHYVAAHIAEAIPVPGYGQHDAHWLAYYDALGHRGVDVSDVQPHMEIARSCGWWWPFNDVCVLTARPARLALDARGRLHRADGPAVEYHGGAELFAWHGTIVEPNTILHPELITLRQIRDERNVTVRSVLLARYGFDRYLDDSGALPIHADDAGTLYRCEFGSGEPLVLVSVSNATSEPDGSRKRFVLRVPPAITEAREAVAWTFSMPAEDYGPVFET